MERKLNIQDWCKAFNRGEFNSSAVEIQCEAGWFDWFCKEKSLVNRTKKLGKFLLSIRDSKKLDFKHGVWFKNNCQCNGSLYDGILFTDEKKKCNTFIVDFLNFDGKTYVEITDVRIYNEDLSNEKEAIVFEGSVKEAIKWFNN